MPVRPLAEADLPEVVDLYWTYMRHRKGTIPRALLTLFHELFFVNPFSDSEFPSLVYEGNDGKVKGFLGRIVRRMSYCGQTIRVVFGGNLVVHPEFRSGIAAARLVSASLSGNHDLALTDSANNISRNILQRLGCSVVPALNVHWRRPLRPSQYALYGLSVATKSFALATLGIAAKPFCMMADSIASRFSLSLFR